MFQAIREFAVSAWLAAKPVLLFAAVAATPANAGVEEVVKSVESNSDALWKIAGGLIITLAGYIWRREHKEFDDYKKAVEKQFENINKQFEHINAQLGSGIRTEYFKEQQLSIHASIDRLRTDIERARMEDLRNNQQTFTEMWNDMKEQRHEAQRISQEIFNQVASTRERMQAHEVNIAHKYHTKEEISDLLTDKVNPIVEELRSMKNILSNSSRRRSID